MGRVPIGDAAPHTSCDAGHAQASRASATLASKFAYWGLLGARQICTACDNHPANLYRVGFCYVRHSGAAIKSGPL